MQDIALSQYQLVLHSVGDYIATVKQTINQTGGPVTAVGHSYGGHVITDPEKFPHFNINNSSTMSKSESLILGLIISVNMNMLRNIVKLWKIESLHLSKILQHQ